MEFPDTENLLRLLLIEKNLSPELRGAINDKAKNLLKGLTFDVSYFLHDELDEEKHSEDDIRTLVQCIPSALSCKKYNSDVLTFEEDDCDGMHVFPIQSVCYRKQYSFLPVLAEEGIKHNVDGDEMRGGLLCEHSLEKSALWTLSCCGGLVEDSRCLDVIKRLREMGLFEKEDIQKYDLLLGSCFDYSSKRFNYFADWDPSLLKESLTFDKTQLLLNLLAKLCLYFGDKFQLALGATLRHYPHELGLLLLKNPKGDTAFKTARAKYGKMKLGE